MNVSCHMNVSCQSLVTTHFTHEWVMSHMNGSCHTWMSHATHMNVSFQGPRTYETIHLYLTWLIHTWHGSHSYMTWLIYMWHDSSVCDMTHLYVTWLIYMWHDSSICDMTHLYVTWLIYMWNDSSICDMTHLYLTWLIYMWHDSSISWFRAKGPRVLELDQLLVAPVCCSVVQKCCSVLQCVAVCCSEFRTRSTPCRKCWLQCVVGCCRVL